MQQSGSFGLTEHLERLSRHGDPLEVLEATVDFEHFRPWLAEGLGYGDGSKGGRAPFDPVSMFKAPIPQSRRDPSDARMEYMIRCPAGDASIAERAWPAVVDAVSGLRPRGADAGREHDPALPQPAGGDGRAQASDEGVRPAPEEEGIHPPSRRCSHRLPGNEWPVGSWAPPLFRRPGSATPRMRRRRPRPASRRGRSGRTSRTRRRRRTRTPAGRCRSAARCDTARTARRRR